MATIGAARKEGAAAPAAAQKLADEIDGRFLQELGANLPARLTASILNGETPGVFVAQFDGGRRNRFAFIFDGQGRMPVANFGLNGGEQGIIYQYQSAIFFPEVWMAFYSLNDYAKNSVVYSDANDAVDVTRYRLTLDVRGVPRVNLSGPIEMIVRAPNVQALSFNVGESLSASQRIRLLNQLRVKRIRLGDAELAWAQEDWEGGFTVFLPKPLPVGDTLVLNLELEGPFLQVLPDFTECFYPFDNVTWLPRHGYLDRAEFDLTFRHRKREKVAAVGTRVSEEPDPEDPQAMITRYQFKHPVPLATFALGPFERKTKQVTFEDSGRTIPLEFNSMPDRVMANVGATGINHVFILDELDNAVRYFSAMFGPYPYESFGAGFHPFGFGQGFPTMVMIPPAGSGRTTNDSSVYSFIAHETSHQWWGNIVAWRSYRDQWLSEGFAAYSGLLYAARRDKDANKTTKDLLTNMRYWLVQPPQTVSGAGSGRLNEIGPIIQGGRLFSTRAMNAYTRLVYGKGALVLRMLHFLMSNPTTGNDTAFFAMMKDFVERNHNGAARTEDFWSVASQHFSRTPIAQKFGLGNLDWFFKEWVYGTGLPTYQLEYEVKTQADNSLLLSGVVKQDGVPPDFQMVLPLVMTFEGNQEARTTVLAAGPSKAFEIRVPLKPKKVELDPFSWVLSEKTSSRGK